MKKYKDVMLDQHPKALPPRGEIDHQIELGLGAKSPAIAHYRMAPHEFVELRK